jgi:hypothetical protein
MSCLKDSKRVFLWSFVRSAQKDLIDFKKRLANENQPTYRLVSVVLLYEYLSDYSIIILINKKRAALKTAL